MSEATNKAVFLSYASQDAEAARRICEALRAAGVEVWFDQSELVGGDAWDQKIRKQIGSCALFMPVISAATQARAEGYFRLEWRLADKRTELMGKSKTFLLPVCIDDTRDSEADVPDSFMAVQWTRLKDGQTTPAFCARVQKLLDGSNREDGRSRPAVAGVADPGPASTRPATTKSRPSLVPAIIGGVAVVAGATWWLVRSPPSSPVSPVASPALPEVRQVVAVPPRDWPKDPELKRAMTMLNGYEAIAEDYTLAEDLARTKVEARPFDPEAVTVMARVQSQFLLRGFDRSDERYAQAKRFAERAHQLAPDEPEALYSLAICLNIRGGGERVEALLRRAMELAPGEASYARYLAAAVVFYQNEATGLKMTEDVAARFPQDPLAQYDLARRYRDIGRVADMEAALDRTIALYPLTNAIVWKARMRLWVHGDPAGMKVLLDRIPARSRDGERAVIGRFIYAMVSGETKDGLAALEALPSAWIEDFDFTGPKHLLQGELLLRAGRPEPARLQFEAALAEVGRQKVRAPTAVEPRTAEVWVLHRLGRMAEARAGLGLVLDSVSRPYRLGLYTQWMFQPPALLLLIGERTQALTLLREAAERPEGRQMIRAALRLDPLVAPWRDDQEIAALLAEPAAGK